MSTVDTKKYTLKKGKHYVGRKCFVAGDTIELTSVQAENFKDKIEDASVTLQKQKVAKDLTDAAELQKTALEANKKAEEAEKRAKVAEEALKKAQDDLIASQKAESVAKETAKEATKDATANNK